MSVLVPDRAAKETSYIDSGPNPRSSSCATRPVPHVDLSACGAAVIGSGSLELLFSWMFQPSKLCRGP